MRHRNDDGSPGFALVRAFSRKMDRKTIERDGVLTTRGFLRSVWAEMGEPNPFPDTDPWDQPPLMHGPDGEIVATSRRNEEAPADRSRRGRNNRS